MRNILLIAALVAALPAAAQSPRDTPSLVASGTDDEWARNARFFVGTRMGVGIPPSGRGVAPTLGLELGVSAQKGFGFGLHIIGMSNPPEVSQLNIAKAQWGLGALADARLYFQSIEPLTLYGTLSGGFLAGPGATGENVVLPIINPGFGARVKMTDTVYMAFEFGMAGFFIPFVTLSMGWEPPRRTAHVIPSPPAAPQPPVSPQPSPPAAAPPAA